MKNQFRHYFSHSTEALKQLTKQALFSFDASFLLDLYRVNDTARSELFAILEKFSEQLWLTHQAADEFLRNRLTVIASLRHKHRSAANIIDRHIEKLKAELNTDCANHPHLDAAKLSSYFDKAALEAKQFIEASSSAHPALSNNTEDDPILKRILDLFDGRVGAPFAETELPALIKEADRRYQQNIPPGFLDKDKDSNQEGDFLIWKQLMLIGKARKRPVIFVTSDRKDDWWLNHSGKVIGPHPLLRKEFKAETNEEVMLYATAQFGEVFMPKTSERTTTLKEIQRVAEASEAERVSRELATETLPPEDELQDLPIEGSPPSQVNWDARPPNSFHQMLHMQNEWQKLLLQQQHRTLGSMAPLPGLAELLRKNERARHHVLPPIMRRSVPPLHESLLAPPRVRLTSQNLFPSASTSSGVRVHSTGSVRPPAEDQPKRRPPKKRKSAKRAAKK